MTKEHPQGSFAPYRPWISNIEHHKRNTGRHSVDDYIELEDHINEN